MVRSRFGTNRNAHRRSGLIGENTAPLGAARGAKACVQHQGVQQGASSRHSAVWSPVARTDPCHLRTLTFVCFILDVLCACVCLCLRLLHGSVDTVLSFRFCQPKSNMLSIHVIVIMCDMYFQASVKKLLVFIVAMYSFFCQTNSAAGGRDAGRRSHHRDSQPQRQPFMVPSIGQYTRGQQRVGMCCSAEPLVATLLHSEMKQLKQFDQIVIPASCVTYEQR